MKVYTYEEALKIYRAFLTDARVYKSKAVVFMRRTEEGLELVGEADKGTSRHAFGFDRVFITEASGDRFIREYSIERR